MMKKGLHIPLPHDITREFFEETLSEGHVMAHELLTSLNFKEGSFFAITSTSADVSKLTEFRYGGILPLNPVEKIIVLGKARLGRKKATSEEELALFLNQTLKQDKQLCCIFEEVAFEKGDPCLSKCKSEIVYFNNEVYYFLKSVACSVEKLLSLIRAADAQWYYMNIITQTIAPQKNQQWSQANIMTAAKNTTHLIIGAYDMEGYVCWEKSSHND